MRIPMFTGYTLRPENVLTAGVGTPLRTYALNIWSKSNDRLEYREFKPARERGDTSRVILSLERRSI